MSILLIVKEISFKYLCMHGLGSIFISLVNLLVALMAVNHALVLDILVYNISPTHISNMTFFTTIL